MVDESGRLEIFFGHVVSFLASRSVILDSEIWGALGIPFIISEMLQRKRIRESGRCGFMISGKLVLRNLLWSCCQLAGMSELFWIQRFRAH